MTSEEGLATPDPKLKVTIPPTVPEWVFHVLMLLSFVTVIGLLWVNVRAWG